MQALIEAGEAWLGGKPAKASVRLKGGEELSVRVPPPTPTRAEAEDLPLSILYEDKELGFCILAHAYDGKKESPPHDHGPSWAIYGQAAGETHMSDYALLEAVAPAGASAVEVGTINFAEPAAPVRIARELGAFVESENLASVRDLVGTLLWERSRKAQNNSSSSMS